MGSNLITWTLGEKTQDTSYAKPTVVLTYVGKDAPFNSTVEYGGVANAPVQASLPAKDKASGKIK